MNEIPKNMHDMAAYLFLKILSNNVVALRDREVVSATAVECWRIAGAFEKAKGVLGDNQTDAA